MYEDGFPSSHPVRVDINQVDEPLVLLDSVLYAKNAAIFRMFEGVIGDDAFEKAAKVKP